MTLRRSCLLAESWQISRRVDPKIEIRRDGGFLATVSHVTDELTITKTF